MPIPVNILNTLRNFTVQIPINTVRDLQIALGSVPIGKVRGEGDLQELRFHDGSSLVLNVAEGKFGDVVSLEKTEGE
jgi:hypothetical protein